MPKTLDRTQQEGVAFLKKNHRVLLADDVGVGKTAQALVASYQLGCEKVLVFTKKYLLHQWEAEAADWLDADVARYTVADKALPNTRYVITNYATATHRKEQLHSQEWDAVIVDEATVIKNRTAEVTKNIKALLKEVPVRFLLTGTPIHNAPTELWSLLHALYPAQFESYWRFINTYGEFEINQYGYKEFKRMKNQELMATQLRDIMIRRTAEVLGLKDPLEETIRLEMPPAQKKIYTDIATKFMADMGNGVILNIPNVVSQFVRLQQILCSPALLGGKDISCKTEAIRGIAEEYAPLEKMVVFTRFVDYAELLGKALEAHGCAVIHGRNKNEDAIKQFQNEKLPRILVSTIGVGSEGLNLQQATVVVFADLPFVPKDFIQCIGRAQRRGQTQQVRVIKLVADKTIDNHIEGILRRKDQYISELEAVNEIMKGMRSNAF